MSSFDVDLHPHSKDLAQSGFKGGLYLSLPGRVGWADGDCAEIFAQDQK